MGRGNTLPHGVMDSKFFYIDFELIHGDDYYSREDYSLMQIEYEDWHELLRQKIMDRWDSFSYEGNWRHTFGVREDAYVLCKNSLVNIELVDNQWSMMLAVVIPEDDLNYPQNPAKNFAWDHMYNYYDGLLEIFKDWYGVEKLKNQLFLRSGPWTSSKIKFKKEVA